jgi:pyridoxine 5-phosphate synthase
VHAGHGLDYVTAEAVCALPEIAELNIGHFIMGEAIYEGLPHVIKRMRAAMTRGRMQVADDEPPPSRP